jgi:polyadenylate-binding protein
MRPISQNLSKTYNSNIFVKFIPIDISEDEIVKVFGEVGTIVSIKIKTSTKMIDNQEVGIYKYGYILYSKVEEAQAAIKRLDGSDQFGGRPIKVDLWQSKEEIEKEKKYKENREVSSILNTLIK